MYGLLKPTIKYCQPCFKCNSLQVELDELHNKYLWINEKYINLYYAGLHAISTATIFRKGVLNDVQLLELQVECVDILAKAYDSVSQFEGEL